MKTPFLARLGIVVALSVDFSGANAGSLDIESPVKAYEGTSQFQFEQIELDECLRAHSVPLAMVQTPAACNRQWSNVMNLAIKLNHCEDSVSEQIGLPKIPYPVRDYPNLGLLLWRANMLETMIGDQGYHALLSLSCIHPIQ
jgi:hypothetical protein